MKFHLLETVVLERDLPEHGLRRGDLGAVVQAYEPDGLEVEFVAGSGRTEALVTLVDRDVRPVKDDDLISVRTIHRAAGRLLADGCAVEARGPAQVPRF